ncbi:MAG TPA: hypothetical protein ENL20_05430 [Candidatus Cloacimonetes bacterium]|nr:hypothetical protein [Candidatus Cloacimonadota bacterium]
MAIIKTAVSIQEPLFTQIENLVKEQKTTRSALFSKALKEFLQRYQNKKMLVKLNTVYKDKPSNEESEILNKMKRKQRHVVNEKW